jgi:hypothetical protein
MINTVTDPFFAGVRTEGEVPIGGGQTISLPIRYFDSESFGSRFLADTGSVRAALPSRRLAPVEAEPGRAVVLLVAYDHRRTDLGSYREFAVWIPFTEGESDDRISLYCHTLPVDSQAAYIAGVELAGFPKYLADIDIETAPRQCRCRVSADGQEIVTLTVVPGAPEEPLATSELGLYTFKGRDLLRCPIQIAGASEHWTGPGGAHLTLGDHPRAEHLRRLGLAPAGLDHSWSPHRRLILHGPDWRAPL